MISRRRVSRTLSYSTRFRISDVSRRFTDHSSMPYAAARIRIGCFACRPVPCSIWSAASGQSVAVTGASARVIASNRGLASFRESSWYCVLKPGPVHRRAFLHHVDRGARDQTQDVRGFVPDVLRAEMARHVVGHGADRLRETRVELPLGVERGQVLEEVT